MLSGSDHRYINFSIHREVEVAAPQKLVKKWAVKKLNSDRLKATYLALTWGQGQEQEGNAEVAAERMIKTVTKACDAAMPRQGPPKKRRAVYWWTNQIAELRKECNRRRRIYQRSRGRKESRAVAPSWLVRG